MHILLRIRDSQDAIARWQDALSAALPEATWHPEANLAPDIADQIRVAVVANPPAGSLRNLPRLEFVQSLWAGVDSLLADTTIPEELVIARMVDPAMSTAMAETALWATISLHRGFFDYQRQQQQGLWHELAQRRAGEIRVTVLGMGAMGLASAKAIAAMGYAVTGWQTGESKRVVPMNSGISVASGTLGLQRILPQTDILINLLPLTPQTRGLLNQDFFLSMPQGACVVNLARGGHVVEEGLLSALGSGHLRHAVLDVFRTEPLPPDHVFWHHPKITILPHIAAITDPDSASVVAAKQIRAWFAGEPIANRVERRRGY
jgi:glyoxylate/hydroxypyruvate reductase